MPWLVHALANAWAELSSADALGLLVPLANALVRCPWRTPRKMASSVDSVDSFHTLANALVGACLGECFGRVILGGCLGSLGSFGECLLWYEVLGERLG